MLISLENISSVFDRIHDDSLGDGTTVWIFVSYDTDSICSSIIFSNILKSENILYKIIPISGWK